MIDHFFHLDFDSQRGLQEQLRESLVGAILSGIFPADEPLPSCRRLSQQLSVSRNTVALVYESLLDSGYLQSRPRSGYYLHPDYRDPGAPKAAAAQEERCEERAARAPEWGERLKCQPRMRQGLLRPSNWMQFAYPFIYGQPNSELFPLEQWREASRDTLRTERNHEWIFDGVDRDDPLLIEQLRTRVLPKRGIWAEPEQILITLGSQNALYLLATLLMGKGTRVGMENPGYRDAWNVFDLRGADIHLQEVDGEGMRIDARLDGCEYLYLTPGHQVPTGVTLSPERRRALLRRIEREDQIVIEDDYDAELNLDNHPQPALKAADRHGRVVYISSLSKCLSPGLRIGYLVADAELVAELRALRRLMYRHPPLNNQRLLAQFLAQGNYDAHLRRFRSEHARRQDELQRAIDSYLGGCRRISASGAGAFWMEAPAGTDTQRLAWAAARRSVMIETGAQHFFDGEAPANCFRLGFHVLERQRIGPGIRLLAESLEQL